MEFMTFFRKKKGNFCLLTTDENQCLISIRINLLRCVVVMTVELIVNDLKISKLKLNLSFYFYKI